VSAPEYRCDPITGRLVILAPDRARRPGAEIREAPLHTSAEQCPFCEGKESETPPESFAVRGDSAPDSPGWQVRFLPNMFPAVRDDLAIPHSPHAGVGLHEVVVEAPRHTSSLTGESPEQARIVFRAYRDRLRRLRRLGRFPCVHLFHNAGHGGGASQEHVHSQLIATPFVPDRLREELAGAATFAKAHACDPWTWQIRTETETGVRIVAQTPRFTAWCPYASRFAHEVWIAPNRPTPHFDDADDAEVAELADLFRDLLLRIETRLGPAYNYYLHTAPWSGFGAETRAFCWHWEITPRTGGIAGWEVGTGMFLNPTSPESAAETLRRS
jgi:UDPglucose--hexose-1-phosphate uridylyltransferase